MPGARFEEVGPGEIGRQRPTTPFAEQATEVAWIRQQAGDFDDDVRWLTRRKAALDEAISRINPKLRPEEIENEKRRLRDEYDLEAAPRLRHWGAVAEAVRFVRKSRYSREAMRRLAPFDADPVRNATIRASEMQRAGIVDEPGLIALAAAAKSAAHASVIAEEVSRRGDTVSLSARVEIDRLLRKVPSGAEALDPLLHKLANGGITLAAIDRGTGVNIIAAALVHRGTSPAPRPTEASDEDADASAGGLTGGARKIHAGLVERYGSSGSAAPEEPGEESDPGRKMTSTQRIAEGLKQRKQRISDNKE